MKFSRIDHIGLNGSDPSHYDALEEQKHTLMEQLDNDINIKRCVIEDILELDKLKKQPFASNYVRQINILLDMKREMNNAS